MATELVGISYEMGVLASWLVWILPFAAAMIIPGVGNYQSMQLVMLQ